MTISGQAVFYQDNHRFDKNLRLLTSKMYSEVFNSTDFKIHQPNLLFMVKRQIALPYSRLGLAITKKKIKRAHERNRVKRLCREYFRLHKQDFIVPVDIILVVKHFSDDISNESLYEQLQQMFEQINVKLVKRLAVNLPN